MIDDVNEKRAEFMSDSGFQNTQTAAWKPAHPFSAFVLERSVEKNNNLE